MENSAIETLLAELDGQGIFVYLKDGRLKLRSRNSDIPAEKLALIRAHKSELIAYMQRHHQKIGRLSRAQQRIWFLDKYENQLSAYNMAGLLKLSQPFSKAQVALAINTVLQQCDVLRSQFRLDGEAVKQVVDQEAVLHVSEILATADVDNDAAAALIQDQLQHRFDLASDLLVQASLITHQGRGEWLYLCMHHIVADGWSIKLFTQALLDELAGVQHQAPALQYLDFVHWESQYQQTSEYQSQLAYWQSSLADFTVFELPTRAPRSVYKHYQGTQLRLLMSDDESSQYSHYCQTLGITPFAGYLGIFYGLLYRYSQNEDITVGVPVLNREHHDFESVVGCFINTLPMRLKVSGELSLNELLKQTQALSVESLANQAVAVEDIIDVIDLAKSTSHSALFQILFNYNGVVKQPLSSGTLTGTLQELDNCTAKYDLTLNINDVEHGAELCFDYASALFDKQFVAQFANDYKSIINEVLNNKGGVPLGHIKLFSTHMIDSISAFSRVEVDTPITVIEAIYQGAQTHPNNTALIQASKDASLAATALSYSALCSQVDVLASRLRSVIGVRKAPLTLLVNKEVDSVIWMLSAMRAGITYLPIDIATPVVRILEVMSQASSDWLLAPDSHLEGLLELESHSIKVLCPSALGNLQADITYTAFPSASDIAYIMFTSGSTGRPKGAELSHEALVRYVDGVSMHVEFGSDTCAGVVTGLATDLGLTGIFPVLVAGGSVVLSNTQEPAILVDSLVKQGVNFVKLTPSFTKELLPWFMSVDGLKIAQWVLGGESLSTQLVTDLYSLPSTERIFNHYGPTETCIGVCAFEVPKGFNEHSVPIGQPFSHVSFAILDEKMQPVPCGTPGELFIGGSSVALGYVNDAAQTAKSFVHLAGNNGQSRCYYRTGDRVKCNFENQIEFLNRLDKQLKINGFRVDLADIEAKLSSLPEVNSAAVITREISGTETLLGYFIASDKGLDSAQYQQHIRHQLKQLLPAHLIPTCLIRLNSLPKLANGKIDRVHLQQLTLSVNDESQAPQTPLQRQLIALFESVTGCTGIGITHSFFSVGGHSLLAMRLLNEIAETFSVTLSLKEIFASPSVAELAECIKEYEVDTAQIELRNVAETSQYPLSFAQQRIWFVDHIQGHSQQYNLQGVYTLKGPLDFGCLEQAFLQVIKTQQILTFNYHQDAGGNVYQTHNPALTFELGFEDLSAMPSLAQSHRVAETVVLDAEQSFNLSTELLLRAKVQKLAEQEHVLLITMHHIVSDGWSIGLLAQAIGKAYSGLPSGSAHAPNVLRYSYMDYIDWQMRVAQSEKWQASLAFWQKELHALPLEHALPTDRDRPNKVIQGGGLFCIELPKALRQSLNAFCQESGYTLFQVLKTVFSLWLSRAQQRREVVIATPISGRSMQAFEPLIGNFINTLILRDKYTDDIDFLTALKQTQEQLATVQQHQDIPFDTLVDELQVARSLALHPLSQIVFRVNNEVNEVLHLDGLEVALHTQTKRNAKLDLEVSIIDDVEHCVVEWLYDTALWDEQSIVAFSEQYQLVLRQCLADPEVALSQLQLWSLQAQQLFITKSQSIEFVHSEPRPWANQVSDTATRNPDSDALYFGDVKFTYKALEQISNQLAHCLLEIAFPAQSRIALLLESGPLIPIAMLGIAKAGHVYVPLHGDTPTKALAHIIEDAEVMLTLAMSEEAEKLIEAGTDFLLLDDALEVDSLLSAYPSHLPNADELAACALPEAERLSYIIYTSGSTGTPKGVPISQGNLRGYLQHALRQYLGAQPQIAGAVMSTPVAFDATITAIMPALMSGTPLTIVHQGAELIPEIIQLLWQDAARLFKLTPAHLRAVLALSSEASECLTPHTVVVGGEALESELIAALRVKLPHCRWINEYGPTETTVGVSVFEITNEMSTDQLRTTKDVPIGLPIEGVNMLVVDEFDQPVVRNMPGELMIAGKTVSSGYINQPELTAQKFSLRAVAQMQAQNCYRSGDVVKWHVDNNGWPEYLRYLGRSDEQVKLRGYRIDLDAILHCIRTIPEVDDCALTIDDKQQAIVAHIVFKAGYQLGERDVRQQLNHELPPYMLPAVYHPVDVIPLTRNGKVDKQALIDAQRDNLIRSANKPCAHPETLTEMEQYLLDLYSEVLLTGQIGLDDSFFELGGHSLLAIRLISQIRKEKQIDITLPQLFKTPTISALASVLPQFEKLTKDQEITVASRSNTLPLSFAQQRLWLIDQLQTGSAQYHMPASFMFTGEFDLSAFSAALASVIDRHEVLRSIILPGTSGEAPEQLPRKQVETPLVYKDLSMLPPNEQAQRENLLVTQVCDKPFDLSQDVMLRVTVIKREEQKYWVHFNMHHIASDGWSMAILVRELIAFYRHHSDEQNFPLPSHLAKPLAIQYADFAHWQRQKAFTQTQTAALEYWKQTLDDSPVLHQLPLDYARPKVQLLTGLRHNVALDATTTAAIRAHCQAQGVTLFMWLHSAFTLLVMRLSGVNDVAIGSPVAGREQQTLNDLIGFFVNTLVIRGKVDTALTFNAWLAQQKDIILGAFKHQALPFEQLVEALMPQRSLSHQPIFQILFALQNNETADFALPHLHIEMEPAEAPSMKFDLEVNAIERGDGIELEWNFSSALFSAQTIAGFAQAFTKLIESALQTPDLLVSQLPILSEAQQHVMARVGAMANTHEYAPLCLHDRFENIAYLQKNKQAVNDSKGGSLSYGELWQRSGELASHLLQQGVQAGQRIAVCLSPSVDMAVSLLAILRAGCAYVPIDPKLPSQRIQFILQDSLAAGLITRNELKQTLANLSDSIEQTPLTLFCIDEVDSWQNSKGELPTSKVSDVAYMIYTSGTTGQPKGVQITHHNLYHYLSYVVRDYTNCDLVSSVVSTPLAFDATVTSLWGGLLAGMGVEFLDDNEHMLPQLAKHLFADNAKLFKVTPAHLQGAYEIANQMSLQRTFNVKHQVVIGGEALACEVLNNLSKFLPKAQWVNEYGPTETTVGTCVYHCNHDILSMLNDARIRQVPIGLPMPYSQCVVLDAEQQLVPQGVSGELYICGEGVTLGYMTYLPQHQEKFVYLTLGEQKERLRYYRTGDKARWFVDPVSKKLQLSFEGRTDEQIKLRGYRIELHEIEHYLKQFNEVADACVLLNEKQDNLEGFIVSNNLEPVDTCAKLLSEAELASIQAQLVTQLPTYMLPHRIIQVASIPLTVNGKVDTQELRSVAYNMRAQREVVAPQTELEHTLLTIFMQVLDVPQCGVTDSFFVMGGHSLLAVQCVGLIQEQLGITMPMRILFERPSVAALAKWMRIHASLESVAEEESSSDSPSDSSNDSSNDSSEEMFL
ncbi:non-ribosomal peptide synthetase [Pseudoalteromonas luteoviolacea]|uniref:Carrier domain-containing protein n=1 Tax=Pseudoalteromonas luteoviolacea NCIMB 1942 TaxID=1365253 RepID=A0A167BTG1_9GAMM|nr:non-ribosomal peptide synthetase [Pseudoalteromonas luteoviolacea]KZN46884.1 hypothetical protein N482_11380 [Pseudoalteromonas luteoviolacea NCIMB 1942]